MLCRVLIGACEGCNYPAQTALVAQWIPACERTSAWTFLTTGEAMGTVLAMVSSPYLAQVGGWELIFYVSGGFGVVWLVLFGLLVTRSPETHPYISAAERDYIVAGRRATLGDVTVPTFCSVPWGAFLRYPPFWGAVTAHFCYNYMSFLALSLGPYFFQSTYKVDISSASSGLGYFSCLPYVLLFVAQGVAGVVADWLANTGRLSMTHVRKLFNTLGLLFAATFFGMLGSPIIQHGTNDHRGMMLAMSLLTAGVGIGGVAICGHWNNYYDMSSKYGPHLLGIGTTIATLPGMITNIVSGEILDMIDRDPSDTGEAWSLVFLVAAGVSLFGAVVFLVLADAKQVDFEQRGNGNKRR